jgi:hypothetical protein
MIRRHAFEANVEPGGTLLLIHSFHFADSHFDTRYRGNNQQRASYYLSHLPNQVVSNASLVFTIHHYSLVALFFVVPNGIYGRSLQVTVYDGEGKRSAFVFSLLRNAKLRRLMILKY